MDGDGKADLVWLDKFAKMTVWINKFTMIKAPEESKRNGIKRTMASQLRLGLGRFAKTCTLQISMEMERPITYGFIRRMDLSMFGLII